MGASAWGGGFDSPRHPTFHYCLVQLATEDKSSFLLSLVKLQWNHHEARVCGFNLWLCWLHEFVHSCVFSGLHRRNLWFQMTNCTLITLVPIVHHSLPGSHSQITQVWEWDPEELALLMLTHGCWASGTGSTDLSLFAHWWYLKPYPSWELASMQAPTDTRF